MASSFAYYASAVLAGLGLALIVIGSGGTPPHWASLAGAGLLVFGLLWGGKILIEAVREYKER